MSNQSLVKNQVQLALNASEYRTCDYVLSGHMTMSAGITDATDVAHMYVQRILNVPSLAAIAGAATTIMRPTYFT